MQKKKVRGEEKLGKKTERGRAEPMYSEGREISTSQKERSKSSGGTNSPSRETQKRREPRG